MHRTLWLLGGFGLGAGLMYMLDPDRGEQRRAQARAQVQTYQGWVGGRLPSRRSLRRTTRRLGQQTYGLGQQARGLLTRTSMPMIYRRDWREQGPAPAGQTGVSKGLLMLGWLGLGIGLMYLLDPNTGRRRRALLRDKSRSYWYHTGHVIGQKARDTQNRARGLVAEARQRFRSTAVPADVVLEARVRAQIGHVISHAGAIGVTAHQGRVSLSGPIPENEVEKLLATVESVPGVTGVVNQLEVHTDTTHISGLEGGRTGG